MSEVKDMTVHMRGSKLTLSYDYKTGRINVLSGDLEHVFCNVNGNIHRNVGKSIFGRVNGDVACGVCGVVGDDDMDNVDIDSVDDKILHDVCDNLEAEDGNIRHGYKGSIKGNVCGGLMGNVKGSW